MQPSATTGASLLRRILDFTLVRLLVGVLVVGVPGGVFTALVYQMGLPREMAGVITAIGIAGIGLICYSLYVKHVEQRKPDELAGEFAPRELGLGVAGGILLLSSVVAILALLGNARITGMNSPAILVAPIAMALSSGVFEELLMRGVLFRVVERGLGTWISMGISALFFGAAHMANPGASVFTSVAISLEAGIMLAAAYTATRRLWVPIGIHFGWNFAQGGLFGIAVSGNPVDGWLKTELSGPELLSGGAFGAEGSLVAVVLCLAAGTALVWLTIKRGNVVEPPWVAKHREVSGLS
jgi:uncharacterized protein